MLGQRQTLNIDPANTLSYLRTSLLSAAQIQQENMPSDMLGP